MTAWNVAEHNENGQWFCRQKSGNLSVIQLLVGIPEINPLQQEAQLLTADLCCLGLICRLRELVLLQALQPLCKVAHYVEKIR